MCRIVENAFGILSNRFREFMTPMRLDPEKVETIVLACCSLHNFLRSRNEARNIYMPTGSIDTKDLETHIVSRGNWRQDKESKGWIPIDKQGSNHHSTDAKEIRDYLCDYFNSDDGAVPWQDNMI